MASGERQLHGAVSGENVRRLQATLKDLAFDPGALDGIYGPDTATAVRQYQAARGLIADGIVGLRTWDRLGTERGSRTRGRPLAMPIVGATGGHDVQDVQEALRAAGFDPGAIDSVYGPDTEAAVAAFQRVHGLDIDGIVGPKTRDALLTRRLRLSSTVARTLRDAPADVTPAGLVRSILDHHPEYGGDLGRSTLVRPA